MTNLFTTLSQLLAHEIVQSILQIALISFVALALATFVPRWVASRTQDAQRVFILSKIIRYTVALVGLGLIMRAVGFEVTTLLGAAGVLSVALGFASQTSASNLISGVFLIVERPFAIGDTIRVADTTGVVLSVDALSVKLRTFDNLLVRVPNETMLKSTVVNLTRFPIRRIDIKVGLAYDQDLAQAQAVLLEAANRLNLCLEEPAPSTLEIGRAHV